MENIKFSLFDLFAYAIPGSVGVLAGIILFDPSLVHISDLVNIFQDATVGTGLMLLLASYVIGFAIDSPASWIYYKVGCKIWGQPYDRRGKRFSTTTERTLVRHFSPENNSYLQTWKVLKTMSHNLSFSFLLLGLSTAVRITQISKPYISEWIAFIIITFVSSIIFLNRSSIFDKWYYKDLSETVTSLRLAQRAIKESELQTDNKKDGDILEELLVEDLLTEG